MGEKDRGIGNPNKKIKKSGIIPTLKFVGRVGLGFIICPGDDIAMTFVQATGSMDSDRPVAAIIHQVPDVRAIFEIKNLKG